MSHVNQYNLNAAYGMVGLMVGWPLTMWVATRKFTAKLCSLLLLVAMLAGMAVVTRVMAAWHWLKRKVS